MQPTVSVIIPVYNGEQTLAACVTSFLRQTYPNIEILIIDDGSADRTPEIAGILQAGDPRVNVLRKENGGPASARNLGIAHAKGDRLCFADSDDWVEPEFVAKLLEEACDLAVCGYFAGEQPVVPERPKMVRSADFKTQMLLPQDRAWGGFVWNKLYKTEILRQFSLSFPEDCTVFEDIVFNYRYLAHCERVYLCGEPLYHYSLHSGSLTKKLGDDPATVQKWLNYADAFDLLLPYETDKNVQTLLLMQKVLHTSTAVRALYACGKKKHPQYMEKRRFLRTHLCRFLLYRHIPAKKKIGAVLTAFLPRLALILWKQGESVWKK